MKLSLVVLLGALALPGCNKAIFPQLESVAQLVLADLSAGKTDDQIELDIAEALGGKPGTDVVAILDETLTLLHDLGLIPVSLLSKAETMHAKLALQRAARVK